MDTKNTVLIACSRLVDLAGAEVTTLELAAAFKKMGWAVSVAAFELSGDMQSRLDNLEASYFDLANDNAFSGTAAFDLAWLHHNVSAYRILLDKSASIKKAVFSSLSFFEPVETPPVSSLKFSRYLVNSEENLSYFVRRYPDLRDAVSVFHNSSPASFWDEKPIQRAPSLCRLAIISNHIPHEVRQLIPSLSVRHVSVDVFGLDGRRERVTPRILREYDAVITIGKSVQYCIALQIPIYCYDHFGGNGWLTPESFDRERVHNFSGRGGRGTVDAQTLMTELLEGYANALGGVSRLYELGRRHFVLEENITKVLEEIGPNFSIRGLSETDRRIIVLQNQSYLKHRNIIINLDHVNSEVRAELKEKCIAFEEKCIELKKKSDELEQKSINLESRDQELLKIRSSYSWRLTRPLRGLARALVRNRDNLCLGISWAKFLTERSKAVIRHQGMRVFVTRAARYVNAFCRRRLASLRTREISSFQELSAVPDDEPILVSFIIPVYDRTDVLRIAINSALDQTVRNIEVIIVTDGSPKETIDVVNEFAGNERVKIFSFPRSSGNAVRGRNKGISEARGRYVAFLDSDDIAVPDRLERCLPILETGEADVVYGSWRAIVDGSRDIPGITNGQIVFSPNADLKMLLEVCVPCQSTVIVRKSLFDVAGLLKPAMQYREDHELWARLAFYGGVFRSVPDVLTCLRLHSGNNELNFKDTDDYWFNCVQSEYRISGPKPKKIAFILPGVGISGGIAVVFKHAELLMKAGHDAFVINVGDMGEGDWFPDNPVPIVHVSDPRLYLFRGIEMLFATGWSTAEWLDRLPAVRKLYFVQSDERRFFDDEALRKKIHGTYQIQCEYLTEALWIKRMLRAEFGHEAAYVPNGLDPKQFFPDIPLAPKIAGKLRVLLEGPIVIPFKGMADSYAAIQGLDCEVWIVSSAGKPPADWKYDRFFEGVPFGEMRKIYSSCDIFLKMSRIEGFFGPPMEAMACGCSVVVGKVTGYDEYIEDEVNALVVEQGDVLAARRAVERLIADDALRQRLIRGGLNTISDWSWERSAQSMLQLVNGPEIAHQKRQIHLSQLSSPSSH